jgi:hypothetical protein
MEEINLEKKLNENIIEKLRSSVQDLRCFIELDAEIKESNLKEIENMNILGNLFIFSIIIKGLRHL